MNVKIRHEANDHTEQRCDKCFNVVQQNEVLIEEMRMGELSFFHEECFNQLREGRHYGP